MIPKFRAWHKENEEMFEVYGFSKDKWFLRGKQWPMPLGAIELMQSTGLKDKNGTDIFEGDILYAEDITNPYFWDDNPDGKFAIEWDGGSFVMRSGYEKFTNSLYESSKEMYLFKIIGNIYENPHLLEEG